MLLKIPDGYVKDGKLDLEFGKKMVFPDPYGCMLFQLERMEDLGSAHNFRVVMAREKCGEEEAKRIAMEEVFDRTVIFGLGTTGMFMGGLIAKHHPNAKILFVARSSEDSPKARFALRETGAKYLRSNFDTEEELAKAIIEKTGGRTTMFIGVSGSNLEHRIAFKHKVLGCNGVYNSFSLGPHVEYDTMPFGFENHLIFGSINFRPSLEKAERTGKRSARLPHRKRQEYLFRRNKADDACLHGRRQKYRRAFAGQFGLRLCKRCGLYPGIYGRQPRSISSFCPSKIPEIIFQKCLTRVLCCDILIK